MLAFKVEKNEFLMRKDICINIINILLKAVIV